MSIIICSLETTILICNVDAKRSSLRLTHLGIMFLVPAFIISFIRLRPRKPKQGDGVDFLRFLKKA